jgi:DNA-binding transcriptional LysR family regulator
MKNVSWDSYQVFLWVVRGGGLTGAAQVSGLSPATIGRRMLQLEADLGRSLFHRSQTGYVLTIDGQALIEQLRDMEAAVRRVESWRHEAAGQVVVRVAAGTWGARLLAENFRTICGERDNIRIDLAIGERRAQLAHRENDIGIRAFEPSEPNLAAHRLGEVAYAAYRLANAPEHLAERFIAIDEQEAVSPYLRWPHDRKADRIVATVDRARSLLDLVLSGAGTAVLPCFVGDLEPSLGRIGGEITELRHGQWIASNNDDRSRREIRLVTDRIYRLYRSHVDLFAGRRPTRLS